MEAKQPVLLLISFSEWGNEIECQRNLKMVDKMVIKDILDYTTSEQNSIQQLKSPRKVIKLLKNNLAF